jgi:hypothetical protein
MSRRKYAMSVLQCFAERHGILWLEIGAAMVPHFGALPRHCEGMTCRSKPSPDTWKMPDLCREMLRFPNKSEMALEKTM